jgi:GNAT superfamily N-acetyltransferase
MPMIAPDIRKIEREELPLVRDLAPPEWNLDLERLYRQHYDQPYFYPTVTMLGADVAGTGMANVHSNCAWIGTIIVKEAYRNRGIGAAITHHLIDHCTQRGMETIILSASHAGLPIYEKMGFLTDSQYVFLKPGGAAGSSGGSIESGLPAGGFLISPITEQDFLPILELDRRVSGEDRKGLLLHTMGSGFKYADEGIKGYYLPDFGKGLVIADTDAAGLELLKYKVIRERSSVCIPETNAAAAGLLAALGYEAYLTATRMFLHRNVQWDPQKVYARGSGALG